MNETQFCFIVPAFNCERSIAQTIRSVYAQSYPNWRMILINDMSTDRTLDAMRRVVTQLDLIDRVMIVDNHEKFGEVRNTLESIKMIDDTEVICRLDASDYLSDLDCLAFLDHVYRTYNPACAWTDQRWSFTSHNISGPLPTSSPDIDDCDVYKELRGERWCTSHLKTARRDAFNGINDANYRDDNGNYIMIACDRCIFLPVLHKAMLDNRRRMHVPLCCYHYNINLDNPDLFTEDRSVNQRMSADFIHDRGYIA